MVNNREWPEIKDVEDRLSGGDGSHLGGKGMDVGIMAGSFVEHPVESAVREFVKQGEHPDDIFMRSVLDERQATAIVAFCGQCEDCNDLPHLKQALRWLASRVSVKARGRTDLLQAVVGMLSTPGKMGRFSRDQKDWQAGKDGKEG